MTSRRLAAASRTRQATCEAHMTFLKTVEIDAADAGAHAELLTRLRADLIQAVVIKDVFRADECAKIVADLEANSHSFPTTSFPTPFKSFFYGANLNLADASLRDYFAMVPAFETSLDRLLASHGGFARITNLLSSLDAGRSYAAPVTRDGGKRYMITTLRGHCEGGYIPAHFDNDQRGRPSFQDIAPRIVGDVLSFVLTLSRADRDGTLEIFDAEVGDYGGAFRKRDGQAPKPDLAAFERVAFDVTAGTMIVVQSGRFLHRVTPVGGPRKRWTACTFMAASRSGDSVYCWG